MQNGIDLENPECAFRDTCAFRGCALAHIRIAN